LSETDGCRQAHALSIQKGLVSVDRRVYRSRQKEAWNGDVNKNILGPWGANLDDDDYACALAALGVLESTGTEQHRQSSDPGELAAALEDEFALGERTPVWRQPKGLVAGTTSGSWHETAYGDPAALAAAWRQFSGRIHHERALPRIAVPLDWRDYPDIVNLDDLRSCLQRADRLNALVMALPRSGPKAVAWHWPLRVGVPEGPDHTGILDELRAAQRQRPWVERLARCFTVGSARDACDLLILSPLAALHEGAQRPGRIRASFVACLEDPPPLPSPLSDRCHDLCERLGAAGVAAVGRFDDGQQRLGDWFVEVLRQVSHDVPIHAALWSVGRHHFNRDTLVIGHPPALDTCRILAIAERQDRIVATLTSLLSDEMPATVPGGEPTFGGVESTRGAPSPGSLQPRFADELRSRMFTSESVDGDRVVSDFERRVREIDEARAPRWIQADAWRGDAPAATAGALAPAQWNVLAVHIGPSEVARGDAAFPDSTLDFTRGDVNVNVQMELAGAAVKTVDASSGGASDLLRTAAAHLGTPAAGGDDSDSTGIDSSEILLPPAGDSTRAWFAVYPHKRGGRIEGRISIIHNNRVLQTARLWVEIDGNADRGEGVVVRSEANIHPADEDLVERRPYDVAIQVSDIGGKLHLTIDRDGEPVNVRLDDLSAPIARIGGALERVAKKWDFTKSMFAQPVFTESLYTLAAAGAELEQHLRKKCGNGIDGWERIHLVPSTSEFFPLEYVYDGPPPKVGAAACPNLLGALDRGSCERAVGAADAASPCPNQRDKSFLCPMHFWGFRKLIERNGTVGALEPASPGTPPAASHQRLCVPSKQAYCKVNGLLFAASKRAFLYATDAQSQAAERTSLVTALSGLCGTVSDASDWDEWRREVIKKPNLLVLIAHTDEYLSTPVLEIGDRQLLGRPEILNDISGAAGQPQLLILLGCSAADVTENFQPYPERFRDAGVSIVLAPVASIRGADAVPIAKRLAQLLADNIAKPEPTAFGELLPLLRRRLLHDGHAGVMGIVGFGDGDWLLGGQPC
jgi:hypothetical protein